VRGAKGRLVFTHPGDGRSQRALPLEDELASRRPVLREAKPRHPLGHPRGRDSFVKGGTNKISNFCSVDGLAVLEAIEQKPQKHVPLLQREKAAVVVVNVSVDQTLAVRFLLDPSI